MGGNDSNHNISSPLPSSNNNFNANNRLKNKPSTPPPINRPDSIINVLNNVSSDKPLSSNNHNQKIKDSVNHNNKQNAMDIDKDYKSQTIKQLKELCKQNGLKVGGNKTALIQRLKDPTNETHKKQKSPKKKRKKRKNKNNLMIDTDEDEWSDNSDGTEGSLKDFVIKDNTITYKIKIGDVDAQIIDSDEDYEVGDDINMIRRMMTEDASDIDDDV